MESQASIHPSYRKGYLKHILGTVWRQSKIDPVLSQGTLTILEFGIQSLSDHMSTFFKKYGPIITNYCILWARTRKTKMPMRGTRHNRPRGFEEQKRPCQEWSTTEAGASEIQYPSLNLMSWAAGWPDIGGCDRNEGQSLPIAAPTTTNKKDIVWGSSIFETINVWY